MDIGAEQNRLDASLTWVNPRVIPRSSLDNRSMPSEAGTEEMRTFRRIWLGSLVAATALLAAAAPTGSAALTCPGQTYVQPFTPWFDYANYVALPNGSFESTSGWMLAGGAAKVSGNEPFHVNNAKDSNSLSLPPGASATSPPLCVTLLHPDLRFFAQNTGSPLATLKVDVITTVLGLRVTTPVASLLAGPSWQPTLPLPFLTNLVSPLTDNVQFRFTAVGSRGAWRIDDSYVDPFKER
jgi:hypothetical protein